MGSERESIVHRLARAGCVAADEEADQLVAAAPDSSTLEVWVRRREDGEPLAWITGRIDFGGRSLRVAADVYVPRFQTEELARRAALVLAATAGGRAADLCTGAGAIAAHVAAQVPTAFVVGVDIDERAVRCARSNGVSVILADAGEALRSGAFDVVTAVAPYVPTNGLRLLPSDVQRFESRVALDGGPDGLDVVRSIVRSAARLLRPGGWLLTELGGEQDRALLPVLAANGFGAVTSWFDGEGDLRGLAAQREPQSSVSSDWS